MSKQTSKQQVALYAEDIKAISEFFAAFPDSETVSIISHGDGNSSDMLVATVYHVEVNGIKADVSKTIRLDSSW